MSEQENKPEKDDKLLRPHKLNLTRLLGIVLLAAAVLLWIAAPAVLLTPLSAAQKVWTTTAFLVVGEVAFWAATVALGREVFRRYRRFLNPGDWFSNRRR